MKVDLELTPEVLEAIAERVAELLQADTPAQPSSSPYLSISEAAEFLRAKPHRVYDLLSARRLTRYKDGSRVLVSRAELEAHLSGVAQPLPAASRKRMNTRVAA